MEQHQKAAVLLEQGRYKEAGKILSVLLQQDPEDTWVLGMLSQVEIHHKDYARAHALVDSAIALEPDESRHFFLKALINNAEEKFDAAIAHLLQAIELDPYEEDYHALLAMEYLHKKQYQAALDAAEAALEIAPDHINALNVRSKALLKLGRSEEAFRAIDGSLEQDPNNAFTHATYGWNLLERGEARRAMEHFREALRIDPDLGFARSGMAEALKSRYAVYRYYLQFMLWLSGLTKRYQWGVIIGIYLAFRLLNMLADKNEALRPWVMPLIILMYLFMISTWLMGPLANLFLRLNAYGRYLLDDDDIKTSNLVGISFGLSLLGLATGLLTGSNFGITLFLYGLLMIIPLRSIFTHYPQTPYLRIATAALGAIGGLWVLGTVVQPLAFNWTAGTFPLGVFAFTWAYNYVAIKQDNP